jgi:hypothetical protein
MCKIGKIVFGRIRPRLQPRFISVFWFAKNREKSEEKSKNKLGLIVTVISTYIQGTFTQFGPGGAAQWSSHAPEEPKTWVRILPGY